jgi:hypothetical protein
MGLKAPKGNENRNYIAQPSIEPGTYPARLVQVLDLGLQPQRPFQGQEKPPAREIMLTYELVDCFMIDENGDEIEEKPRWISETFPLHSLNSDKAKSTKRYLAFDPEMDHEGDFSQLIGFPINVTVVNNQVGDKVYDNIAATSPMRPKDAVKCPDLKNPTKVLDLEAPDMEVFKSIPEWLREKIMGNLEFKGSALEKALGGVVEDKPKKEAKKPAKPVVDEEDEDVDNDRPF